MVKKFLPYLMPLVTIVFLLIYFVFLNEQDITGFIIQGEEIIGYIKINVLGTLPEDCSVDIKFFQSNSLVKEIELTKNEFAKKSRVENKALEEIYYLDINKIINERIDADKIDAEIWCREELVANASSFLSEQ